MKLQPKMTKIASGGPAFQPNVYSKHHLKPEVWFFSKSPTLPNEFRSLHWASANFCDGPYRPPPDCEKGKLAVEPDEQQALTYPSREKKLFWAGICSLPGLYPARYVRNEGFSLTGRDRIAMTTESSASFTLLSD